MKKVKTFQLTDGCMWEKNKQEGTRHRHAIEVVDIETGQVQYIPTGAKIQLVSGVVCGLKTQKKYNEYTK